MTIVDTIMELFARRGAAAYHGEAVSQTEHALQAADLAEREGAPDRLVVAALTVLLAWRLAQDRKESHPAGALHPPAQMVA